MAASALALADAAVRRILSALARSSIAWASPSASRIAACATALGGEHRRLLLAVGTGDRRLLVARRLGDRRTTVALGTHLGVHRGHDFRRWIDPLDLDAHHPDAPLVGGVVEHLAELGVDLCRAR